MYISMVYMKHIDPTKFIYFFLMAWWLHTDLPKPLSRGGTDLG